ncbi:MAG: hypothetical protein H7Y37_07010 [Anaerolineae bacterium]|nr:hypothetical protein [Gloeobacterales cyanobacterium ES-bin-313]
MMFPFKNSPPVTFSLTRVVLGRAWLLAVSTNSSRKTPERLVGSGVAVAHLCD